MLLEFEAAVDHGPLLRPTFCQIRECIANMPPGPVLEAMVRDFVAKKKPGRPVHAITIVNPRLSDNRREIAHPPKRLSDLVPV